MGRTYNQMLFMSVDVKRPSWKCPREERHTCCSTQLLQQFVCANHHFVYQGKNPNPLCCEVYFLHYFRNVNP
jgi:hypothetical protein